MFFGARDRVCPLPGVNVVSSGLSGPASCSEQVVTDLLLKRYLACNFLGWLIPSVVTLVPSSVSFRSPAALDLVPSCWIAPAVGTRDNFEHDSVVSRFTCFASVPLSLVPTVVHSLLSS